MPSKSAPVTDLPSESSPGDIHPLCWLLLYNPPLVMKHLQLLHQRGHIPAVPGAWQVSHYVLYMWHRIIFRYNTVGTHASDDVRDTWRARLWTERVMRFPFLVAEGAVNGQYDTTGLGITVDRKIKHLVGAFHPGDNFMYDLALVDCYPGKMAELRQKVLHVLEHDNDRTRFLRDLVVYDDYHQRLLAAIDRVMAGDWSMTLAANDTNPDTSILNFAKWCLKQPQTPGESFQALLQGKVNFAPKV